jgi:hypothetical protein
MTGRSILAALTGAGLLLAGCAANGDPPSHSSARSSPAVERTRTSLATVSASGAVTRRSSHPRQGSVGLADLVSSRLALFTVGPHNSGRGPLRLYAATAAGRHLREIGPPHVRGWIPDHLFALDRRHIWLAAFNVDGRPGDRLYRTRDGGRTWRSAIVPGHTLAGGSTDDIQFVSADDGWLADQQPTGPDESLYHSTDGGLTWHVVARPRTGVIPTIGDVWFAGGTGWLGGSSFGNPIYASKDEGHHWRRVAIPAPRDSSYGLPVVFGSTALAPILSCTPQGRTVRIYRGGTARTWHTALGWHLPALPDPRFGCGQFSVAIPTRNAAWAVAFGDRTALVGRAVDGPWASVADPAPAATFATIYALDARRAWLLADGRIHVTTDGGQSWRTLRVP